MIRQGDGQNDCAYEDEGLRNPQGRLVLPLANIVEFPRKVDKTERVVDKVSGDRRSNSETPNVD